MPMTEDSNLPTQEPDWHIDKDALERYYIPSEIQPLAACDGLRIQPIFGNAEGYREIINLTEGFQVVLGDITCHEEAYVSMKSDPSLKLHFRLEGSSGLGIRTQQENKITHHTMGILLHPEGIAKQEHYLAGEHERSVTLICEADFLRQRYEPLCEQLPKILADYINGEGIRPLRENMLMRTDMVTAANSVLASDLDGVLRKAYIYAKSIELLVLSIQTIIEAHANHGNREKGLKQRDIERIHKARELLEANFITPPTLNDLAREIGVNEAKLMHTFKQIFGQTIFDFTQNLRMDQAKELLEKTERSITEIAFDVGYDYSSNFTTAFKRRFGITPSLARNALKK